MLSLLQLTVLLPASVAGLQTGFAEVVSGQLVAERPERGVQERPPAKPPFRPRIVNVLTLPC